jgi:hypothetical protein
LGKDFKRLHEKERRRSFATRFTEEVIGETALLRAW